MANYLFTASTLVIGLIVTPLLFDWLGDDRVGLYRVGIQWIGYTALLSGWVDSALLSHFSRAFAAGDREALLQTARTGLRSFGLTGLAGMFWITIIGVFAPELFHLDDPRILPDTRAQYLAEIRIGLAVVGATFVLSTLSVFRNIAESGQRGYIVHLAVSVSTILGAIASVVLAMAGAGLTGQFAAFALTTFLPGIFLAVDGLRRYPEILRGLGRGAAIAWKQAFDGALFVFLCCVRISYFSDAIVISLIVGSVAVAQFVTTQALSLMLQSAVLAVSNATWPAMANLLNSGKRDVFAVRMLQLTRGISLIGVALVVPSAVWNHAFVVAWVREESRYGGDLLTAVTALSTVLFCVMWLWTTLIITTGRVRQTLKFFLIGFAFNVVFSLGGSALWGTIGPPLGTLANSLVVIFGWLPAMMEREYGTPRRALVRAAIVPVVLALPYALVLIGLNSVLGLNEWSAGRLIKLVVIAVLIMTSALFFLVFAWSVAVPASDRQEAQRRFFRRSGNDEPPKCWHILSPTYPPNICGVGDQTSHLAAELSGAGREVHVWTACQEPDPSADFTVHTIPGLGASGRRILSRELNAFAGPRTLFVQYTPSLYGQRSMNVAFAFWVLKRRLFYGDDVRLMFHEVAIPWVCRPLRYNILAAVHRVMAWILVKASCTIYLSTDDWKPIIRRLGCGDRPVTWLPITASMATSAPPAAIARYRAALTGQPVFGHFGTYSWTLPALLTPIFASVLKHYPEAKILLIGKNSESYCVQFLKDYPEAVDRLVAVGELSRMEIAAALRACDVVIQPAPGGANCRRSSLLAVLANGLPVVTNRGPMTEPLWDTSGLPLVSSEPEDMLTAIRRVTDDPDWRTTVATRGAVFYERNFSTAQRLQILLPSSPQTSANPH